MEYKESYISVINTADSDWEKSIINCEVEGELIFAYKNTQAQLEFTDKEELYQVIVKRAYNPDRRNKFSVSIVTSKTSYMYNLIPIDYLRRELLELLQNFKVDEGILSNFEQILEDLEK
jgi:hypothetical protein